MAHEVTIWTPGESDDDWHTALAIYLEDRMVDGWRLVTMTERTVEVTQTGGMTSTSREEHEMVLVFYRA